MNAKVINAFISSILYELKNITNWELSIGKAATTETLFPARKASIHFGVNGDILGQVIISFGEQVAKKLASIMNLNIEITDFHGMARYSLEEFSNRVLKRAIFQVATLGYNIYATPATIVIGDNVFISTGLIQTIVIPVITSEGEILLNLGLMEKQKGGSVYE